jgi:hypothetical protein
MPSAGSSEVAILPDVIGKQLQNLFSHRVVISTGLADERLALGRGQVQRFLE